MKKFSRDKLLAVVLFAIGLAYLVMTLSLKRFVTASRDPGPKIFPLIACIGLMICSVVIFFQKKEEAEPFLNAKGWGKIIAALAIMTLYVVGLKYLGFLISTPPLLFGLVSLFQKGENIPIFKRLLFSVIASFVIYFVFVKMLKTILPRGIFYF